MHNKINYIALIFFSVTLFSQKMILFLDPHHTTEIIFLLLYPKYYSAFDVLVPFCVCVSNYS